MVSLFTFDRSWSPTVYGCLLPVCYVCCFVVNWQSRFFGEFRISMCSLMKTKVVSLFWCMDIDFQSGIPISYWVWCCLFSLNIIRCIHTRWSSTVTIVGNQLLIEIIYSMFCLQWGFTATIFLPVGYPIDIIVKNKDLKKLFLPTAIRIFLQNFRICNVSCIGIQYIGAFCYSFHFISLWSTL